MAVQLPRWQFTVDDFERMIAAGILGEDDRVELVAGEVVAMAAIGGRHAESVFLISDSLVEKAGRRAHVWVQSPLSLPPYARPEPDLLLLRAPRARYRGRLPTAEDVLLVVEVAESSLIRDRDEKIPMYGRAGLPEAWLVDLVNDLIRLYREPTGDGYRIIQTARRGETIAPLAFPDWRLLVDDLLPDALAGP